MQSQKEKPTTFKNNTKQAVSVKLFLQNDDKMVLPAWRGNVQPGQEGHYQKKGNNLEFKAQLMMKSNGARFRQLLTNIPNCSTVLINPENDFFSTIIKLCPLSHTESKPKLNSNPSSNTNTY